jgi:hypothetical protein
MIGVSAEDSVAVEQLVRDAEFAAARGRTDSAIRCLEEASKIDPSRQDLSRAIRDLRRKKEFTKAGAKRSLKLAFAVVLVSAIFTTIILREVRIWSRWKSLPEASRDDVPGMRARLAGINDLLGNELAWLSMGPALLDRDLLKHDIELAERPIQPVLTDRVTPGTDPTPGSKNDEAEESRTQGLQNAEKGHIADAIKDLKHALEVATPEWPHRQRVEADVVALEAWQKKNQ